MSGYSTVVRTSASFSRAEFESQNKVYRFLQTRLRPGVDEWEEDGGFLPLASFSWEAAGSYWASYPSLHKHLYGLRGGSTCPDPLLVRARALTIGWGGW
ncbi:jg18859 [Pararge aegeria aegeria]|uniref:Jg18859 protein n=1 Tax=Pararge aegeria aegeria TaxID=348720 RepID=A0A8S4RIN4_9NEOP|nr:jg18859 [Pararge aegeria aegeria]